MPPLTGRLVVLYSMNPYKSTTGTMPSSKSKSGRRLRPPASSLDPFYVRSRLDLKGSGLLSGLTGALADGVFNPIHSWQDTNHRKSRRLPYGEAIPLHAGLGSVYMTGN